MANGHNHDEEKNRGDEAASIKKEELTLAIQSGMSISQKEFDGFAVQNLTLFIYTY